ncbi:MAG: DUF924 family protein [Cyanobacteria bacterium J06638_22]
MLITPVQSVLNFWFGDPTNPKSSYTQQRKLWFSKSEETDETIRREFMPLYAQAATSELDSWATEPESCLALLLILDQFPRNMFRDMPRAFATDEKALAIAKHAIERGFDQALKPVQRLFMYLPLEHSETLEDQHRSVALVETLKEEDTDLADAYDYALRHRDVIQRFGRFPHRNIILGRQSTSEEIDFLQQPGSRF